MRLLALLLLAAPVDVQVLTRNHPTVLHLSGPRGLTAAARGDELLVDGAPAGEPLRLPAGSWFVRGPGLPTRRYTGALELRAAGGELALTVAMDLEAYVADVVAAETEPGAPAAALRAQAIVARSYALAAGPRHEAADFCDLAHCQVSRGAAADAHHLAATAAAAQTRGQVLRLADGSIAAAPFHADCGGHTADPAALFGGADRTGAAAIADGCPGSPWEATLPSAKASAAAQALLGPATSLTRLQLRRGPGGFVETVRDPASGASASGEAFARSLDAGAGWGSVRSPRFDLTAGPSQVRIRGRGIGHGVGLCQAGAFRLARQGLDHRRILTTYFPDATID